MLDVAVTAPQSCTVWSSPALCWEWAFCGDSRSETSAGFGRRRWEGAALQTSNLSEAARQTLQSSMTRLKYVPCGEVSQCGGGWSVVQQELWGQQYQGLLVGPVHLATQCMEELRRGGGIHHKQVGLALSIPPSKLYHELLPNTLQNKDHHSVGRGQSTTISAVLVWRWLISIVAAGAKPERLKRWSFLHVSTSFQAEKK